MTITVIVMILIIVLFIVKTINRFAVKDPIHPSVASGLELAIFIGAALWLLTGVGLISVPR